MLVNKTEATWSPIYLGLFKKISVQRMVLIHLTVLFFPLILLGKRHISERTHYSYKLFWEPFPTKVCRECILFIILPPGPAMLDMAIASPDS